jgi:hypothetical protein
MSVLNDTLSRAEEQLRSVGEGERALRLSGLRNSLLQSELRVVIFGEFNRGKSTLINALLGRLILPAKLIPTTGHVTRIVHAGIEEVRVQHVDGRRQTSGLDQLETFACLNREGLARDDIDSIEVGVNCSLLRDGVILMDTPGVNEQQAQTRRSRAAIAMADVVLMVLDARQLLCSHEQNLASDWLATALGKVVLLVVNFMNCLEDESDQAEIRSRLDRWCRAHLRARLGRYWFEVNARGALLHTQGSGPAPTDDFTTLRSALAHCTGEGRRKLQQYSRSGQILAEVREAIEDNARTLARLEDDAARVERERSARHQQLQDLARRFDVTARLRRSWLVAAAQSTLDEELDCLITNWFKGESETRLQQNASRWYGGRLTEAVRTIEKKASAALLDLADDSLGRPEPLTLGERLALNARLDVGLPTTIQVGDEAIGIGAGVGALLGTFFVPIPVLGTAVGVAVGAMFGKVFANVIGSIEPDYVAAYSAKAREKWTENARDVLNALNGQFDVRLGQMRRQAEEELERLACVSRNGEQGQRRRLAAQLDECRRLLEAN